MNWTLLQNGVGIDIQAETFKAVCLKRQWNRIRVADRLEIADYQRLGPQHCGKVYKEFLRKNGLQSPWTVVALPRSAVLLRWLNFPKAVEKDLARAVEYQLDSLHPFEEGSVYWDFAYRKPPQSVLGALQSLSGATGETGPDRIEVPVAIAEKKFIDETTSWFQQAAIGVSQFTVTTAVLLSALARQFGYQTDARSQSAQPFFVINAGGESLDLIGYGPDGPAVSKEIPLAAERIESASAITAVLERELGLMRSELRITAESRPQMVLCGKNAPTIRKALPEELNFTVRKLNEFFPSLSVGAESFRLSEDAVAFTAALGAVDRTLPFSLNLLPPERREYQSPLIYVSAYALTAVIVLLLVALGVRGTFQDWLYSKYLDREIGALQPQLQTVETAQAHSRKAYDRLAALGRFRNTVTLPLGILSELTRILPDDVWLQQMQYDGDTVSLAGSSKSASQLLQILAGSSYFESPQFLAAISRTPDGREMFRIGMRLQKSKLGG